MLSCKQRLRTSQSRGSCALRNDVSSQFGVFQKSAQLHSESFLLSGPGLKESAIFTQFSELIALDFGRPLRTNEDLQMLFRDLATQLGSYNRKLGVVKGSRWFSWHGGCEDHYHEFFATRMLLTFAHPHERDPDENSKTLKELRGGADSLGGLRLALQCCSWKTWYGMTLVKLADKPMWSMYSDSVKKIKDPAQGFQKTLMLSGVGWMSDQQFNDLAQVLLQDSEFGRVAQYKFLSAVHLGEEGAEQHFADFVTGMWNYIIQLLNFRARTMSKYSAGPEVYAAALDENSLDAQHALVLLRTDWRALRFLEASPGQYAQELAGDLRDTVSKPLRLAMQLLEVNRFDDAMSVLKTLLFRMPDSKVVEDIHQRLRNEASANANRRLLPRELQGLVQTGGQLESRGINHPARLTKEAFLESWKTTPSDYSFKTSLDSGAARLPKFFARMLANKAWRTMSGEALSFSSAAWAWIREYLEKDYKGQGFVLKDPGLRTVLLLVV